MWQCLLPLPLHLQASHPVDNQVKSWRNKELETTHELALPGRVDPIDVPCGAAQEEYGQADEDGEDEHHHSKPGDGPDGEGKAFHNDAP